MKIEDLAIGTLVMVKTGFNRLCPS